jgi:hypothetical protein
LLYRERTDHAARGTDRDQAVGARQAAEALFKPKPPVFKEPEAHLDPLDNPQPRRPRVLSISAPEPRRFEHAEASRPAAATPQKRIGDAEAARVRTWVKYGMTIAEVAKVYGVTLIEVQRVLSDG